MPAITITLKDRVRMAADALTNIRAQAAFLVGEEAKALDQLALTEAEVLGKGPGWEEATLSGLIEDGTNPHYQPQQTYTGADRAAAAGITKEGPMERPEDAPEPAPEPEPEDEAKETKPKHHGKGKG